MRPAILAAAASLAALLASEAVAGPAELATPGDLGGRLDARVPALMEASRLPGAVVLVVDREGTRLLRGYGVADSASGAPVDPERTVWRVASVSKLFTATAAMQLVEAGDLSLGGDVNDALAGVRVARVADEPVTLWHLLTHTAGFGARFLGYASRTREGQLPLERYLAERLPRPFIAPGRVYSYANHGTAVVGLLVEQARRRPFPEAVEATLLAPLGMGDSSFAAPPRLLDRLATGYVLSDGAPHPVGFDFQHATPPGFLVTTAPDMARFLRMHLNRGTLDGRRLLLPETVAAMHRRQFSHHPEMAGVGLGFHEYEIGGWRCVGHDGDTGGFNARAFLVPELGLGIFLAYTGSDQTKRFADAVTRRVLEAVQGPTRPSRPGPASASAPAGSTEAATGYEPGAIAGLYRWTRYDRDSFEKGLMSYPYLQFRVEELGGGAVRVAASPLPVFPTRRFEPAGDGLFRADDGVLASFRAGEGGRATHLLYGPTGVLPMAHERIPEWRGAVAQGALAAGFALAWPALALVFGVAMLRGRGGGHALTPSLALAASLANAAFLLLFPATTGLAFFGEELGLPAFLSPAGSPPFFYGSTPAMLAILTLPLVALALEAAVAGRALRAGRQGEGTRSERLAASILVLVGLAFAAFLHEWCWLGYRL